MESEPIRNARHSRERGNDSTWECPCLANNTAPKCGQISSAAGFDAGDKTAVITSILQGIFNF